MRPLFPFDKIYNAALLQDSHELVTLIKQDLSVDQRIGGFTVAGWLALEGKKEAVEFLRRHGASVHGIVQGYASRGDDEEIDHSIRHGIKAPAVAYANALAGRQDKVGFYRDSLNKNAIAQAYAKKRNYEALDNFLRQNPNVSRLSIAEGFAEAGDHSNVEKVYEDYLEKKRRSRPSAHAIGIWSGNYAAWGSTPRDYIPVANAIAKGYARRGDCEKVQFFYTERDATASIIVCAFAEVGNHAEVSRYFEQFPNQVLKGLVEGYAKGGYHSRVEFYYQSENQVNLITKIAAGYIQGGYFDNETSACFIFSCLENTNLKNELFAELKKKPAFRYDLGKVFNQANEIHRLMSAYSFHYDQASAFFNASENFPRIKKWLMEQLKPYTNEKENGPEPLALLEFLKKENNSLVETVLYLQSQENLLETSHRGFPHDYPLIIRGYVDGFSKDPLVSEALRSHQRNHVVFYPRVQVVDIPSEESDDERDLHALRFQ